ncbi:MAG: PH domain-containing protein, partial [Williamsia herbipolensis]|nr:PH domain-containing protein [Williamsia herbipolensis]
IGAAVIAAWSLTRWFTTRLRITPRDVQLRTGLLRRQNLSTARDRIRTVDVTAHLLHRVLGLGRVVVGTGNIERGGKGALVLDGLLIGDAERLRDDLLHRGQPTSNITADEPEPARTRTELARLNRRWIGYAPFTLSGVLTGVVLWGFYWRIQGESGVDLTRYRLIRSLRDWFTGLSTATAVLVVVAAVVLFIVITSTAGYVLAFWNFRLVRDDGGTLQVTRGLLTTRATSIERRRLVGVQISEPLLLRAVGAGRVLAVATGLRVGRGAERGGEILLPPAPMDEVRRTSGEVLDDATVPTAALHRHPPAARRRHLFRAITGGLIVAAVALGLVWVVESAVPPPWLVLTVAVVSLAASAALGRDRYASLGHAMADGYLLTGQGSVVRRRSVVHTDAVIGWNFRSTYFQRRLGLVTAVATTAAGRQGYSVVDTDPRTALELAERVNGDVVGQFRST